MKKRKPNRKRGYDYSQPGIYFLTTCCKYRIHHFGYIENGEMVFNDSGKIACEQIEWLRNQYSNIIIHNSVVMPNHVHLLVELVGTGLDLSASESNNGSINRTGRDLSCDINERTGRDLSLPAKSISTLMGAFKTTASAKIHANGNPDFNWQRSFHDHIIRNEPSYQRIYEYITENPKNWNTDILKEPDPADTLIKDLLNKKETEICRDRSS